MAQINIWCPCFIHWLLHFVVQWCFTEWSIFYMICSQASFFFFFFCQWITVQAAGSHAKSVVYWRIQVIWLSNSCSAVPQSQKVSSHLDVGVHNHLPSCSKWEFGNCCFIWSIASKQQSDVCNKHLLFLLIVTQKVSSVQLVSFQDFKDLHVK